MTSAKLLAVLCVVALVAAVFATPRTVVQRKSIQQHCISGRPHVIHYDVKSLDDDTIILLDSVSGLSQVECDISHTRLLLEFSSNAAMDAFAASLKPTETVVTASDRFDCVRMGGNETSFIMRRVLGIAPAESPLQMELETTPARYDEVIQDGTISIGPDSDARVNACTAQSTGRETLAEKDKTVCVGVNTDPSCTRAAGSLPVYSNQYVDVQCSNCFLGVTATMFAELKIGGWRLQQLAGGLKNIAVQGAVQMDMNAHAQWSVGTDRTLPVVRSTTVLNFWVGPIPVRVWFEVPVEMKGDFSFAAAAHATVGATADWQIGDAYVQWDAKTHWTAVAPTPHFSWQPIINGDAQFQSQGSFTLKPTVTVHVDNLFQSSLVIDPTLDMQAQGDVSKRQLCATLGYNVDISIGAELDINISWLNIHEDRTYGPKSLYASGHQTIGHWCA